MAKEKLLKSEKIRIKNDELRKKGKEPAQGWGEMVNTKFGGGGAGSGLNGSATNLIIWVQSSKIKKIKEIKRYNIKIL